MGGHNSGRNEKTHWFHVSHGNNLYACNPNVLVNEGLTKHIFYKIKLSNHLQLILKFLHFNDNSFYEPNNENQDRLYKEEPHTEILCEHCMHVYALKLKLKVDESQMLFKC